MAIEFPAEKSATSAFAATFSNGRELGLEPREFREWPNHLPRAGSALIQTTLLHHRHPPPSIGRVPWSVGTLNGDPLRERGAL